MMRERDTRVVRGDATRKRLVEEGLRLFASMGYSAVSTREIAKAANVNHAAIGFHYKGKLGLYEAVIDYMIEKLHGIVDPFVSTIEKNIGDCSSDNARLRNLITMAVEQFLMASMRSERSRWISVLLQREYADPSDAFARIYSELAEPIFSAVEKLVKAALGEDSEAVKMKISVYCIMSQLTNIGRDRAIIIRRFNSETFESDMFSTLISVVAQGICGILGI